MLFMFILLTFMCLRILNSIMIFMMSQTSFILYGHMITLIPNMVIQENFLAVLPIEVRTDSPLQVAVCIYVLILTLLFFGLEIMFLLLMPETRQS